MLYTTGKPWSVRKDASGISVLTRHGQPVAMMASLSAILQEQDAQLISAAPDLLYALESMCHAYGIDGTGTARAIAHERAFLALQKAKGVFNAQVR